MPQRKDPDIPVKVALVETHWPGASAERVEELVTKTIEKVLASNSKISKIESTSRSNVSIIIFAVSDEIKDASQVLDDVGGRLAAIQNLPDGAGPISYQRDFGDTATLMLTVASPKMSDAEIGVRAKQIRESIASVRAGEPPRASLVICFPPRDDFRLTRLGAIKFVSYLQSVDPKLDARLLGWRGMRWRGRPRIANRRRDHGNCCKHFLRRVLSADPPGNPVCGRPFWFANSGRRPRKACRRRGREVQLSRTGRVHRRHGKDAARHRQEGRRRVRSWRRSPAPECCRNRFTSSIRRSGWHRTV